MNCEIIATHRFEKEVKRLAKKYISLREDLRILYTELKSNPRIGTPLRRNCYKIRVLIKSKGKGKRGGGRVVTYLVEESTERLNIFLLSIYDKSEIDTLTDSDIVALIDQIKTM